MFTSKKQLAQGMGVDADIAAFFVDRKVPENNTYWKGRLLYIGRGTGYLFIPLFFDIQHKLGLSKAQLLSKEYVELAEAILDSAGKLEENMIDFKQHIDFCKSLMSPKVVQQQLYADLNYFFETNTDAQYKYLGTKSKALNRGDTMLYMLCVLEDEALVKKIIEHWYMLVPSFLLMDDVMDLHEDKKRNEENSIDDFGEGKQGLENALQYLSENFKLLQQINSQLGNFFQKSLDQKRQSPYLQQLLNS